MTTIQFFDAQGHTYAVQSKNLTFRPAVYGILIEQNQILLLHDRNTGLFLIPGRMLDENEVPNLAIRTYFREWASITPQLGTLLFIENQYRQDADQSWQLSALYYEIKRPPLASITFLEKNAHFQPEWVQLDTLVRTQFQFGYEAVQAGKLYLQL